MNLATLEHQVIVRFEHDIHELFKAIKLNKKEVDSGYWLSVFSAYIDEWYYIMQYYIQADFRIWIQEFRECYLAVMLERNLRSFKTENVEFSKEIIETILQRLIVRFGTVAFAEKLKLVNEMHSKRVEREIEKYHQATAHYYQLRTITLGLGYDQNIADAISICTMAQHIQTFEKRIRKDRLLKVGLRYDYQRVMHFSQKNQYMILFVMVFDENVIKDYHYILSRICAIWQEVAGLVGEVFGIEKFSELQSSDEIAALTMELEDPVDDLETMLRTTFNTTEPESRELRVWLHGFNSWKSNVMR
ncbi:MULTISPECIES: hypothetical protein [Acinetobacter calcoaceticus/baumannii complex]|uniref:hypothetical protein n=1 Tax=Acinetobacter calcoaceticus/baumannii complex TaxID=909768 RepID=UPI000C7718C1|nr:MULTISPECIES: hypothetical protein [Acinetobacter calcoaceticus/baumannii complex]AUM27079.1 hypothetical protein BVD86_09345 [Acinetobacter pittii]MDB0116155.1 hypothetical protein [Acinetobacter baumannii]